MSRYFQTEDHHHVAHQQKETPMGSQLLLASPHPKIDDVLPKSKTNARTKFKSIAVHEALPTTRNTAIKPKSIDHLIPITTNHPKTNLKLKSVLHNDGTVEESSSKNQNNASGFVAYDSNASHKSTKSEKPPVSWSYRYKEERIVFLNSQITELEMEISSIKSSDPPSLNVDMIITACESHISEFKSEVSKLEDDLTMLQEEYNKTENKRLKNDKKKAVDNWHKLHKSKTINKCKKPITQERKVYTNKTIDTKKSKDDKNQPKSILGPTGNYNHHRRVRWEPLLEKVETQRQKVNAIKSQSSRLRRGRCKKGLVQQVVQEEQQLEILLDEWAIAAIRYFSPVVSGRPRRHVRWGDLSDEINKQRQKIASMEAQPWTESMQKIIEKQLSTEKQELELLLAVWDHLLRQEQIKDDIVESR